MNALFKGRFFIKNMQVDYIIVGFGLAGICVAEKLRKEHKSFVVLDRGTNSASKVAGGIYNPTILKRFTLAWEADLQLSIAKKFYGEIERFLDIQLLYPKPILRRFNSFEEQNNWFTASDKEALSPFLNTNLVKNVFSINSNFSFGKVNQTGFLDTMKLISVYKKYLIQKDCFVKDEFDYDLLDVSADNSVSYKNLKSRHIVFCEGHGLSKNPFFSYLPITGNKGEYLTIKCENLKLNEMIKFTLFILPLGNDLYKVGATYNRDFEDILPTNKAKGEIKTKLDKILEQPYEIVKQDAGIRPTTKDRRPLLGRHPEFLNMYVNNGFGSRGVIIAPSAAGWLYDFIEKGKPLPNEVNASRFS
jgi:glycine/D-amino acid oxidase-like deaminating enzyme